ncbi:MAG: hypothetical protein FJ304_07410 [Planctomycetes bacterium]|nr:hypothetical protein [Planctomycetota bacterium]
MATVQEPRTKASRHAERDPQVYHPLDRLRGIIRKYVVIEGVLSAVLFVALWFTLGMILDFGLFKISGWDWVRDGGKWVRAAALVAALGLFAALLVFRIARRLTTEFSYPALALVLERKFPQVLGDRLITAVEMADVEAMAKFGYSKEMIRTTIAEARERVGKVAVNQVFNWRRLWVMGFLAVGLVLGTVVVAFATHSVATKGVAPKRFAWKFAHVSGIFVERNVALMDTPWPRRAHLELYRFKDAPFPATGEVTVGRDEPPPRVVVRAYRWVIADRHHADGWRPLTVDDLTENLVGRAVPTLPEALRLSVAQESPLTVDTLELLASESGGSKDADAVKARALIKLMMNMRVDPQTKATSETQDFEALQEVFKALEAKADQPSMGRTLRRLDDVDAVKYRYDGVSGRTGQDGPLTQLGFGAFGAEITGMKEDVVFVASAADYTTAPRKIRLIPPPTLARLGREQAEPAYLHHEPPRDEGYGALKGRFQKVAAKDLPLTGDRSVVAVPAGTEITLTAEAYVGDSGKVDDTDRIVSAFATPVSGRFPGTHFDALGKPTQRPVALIVTGDGTAFRIAFTGDYRINETVEFKITWTNKFNVTSTRVVQIQAVVDQPPTVEVAVDVIRKLGNVYLVTPKARIPFNPDSFIKDDHGLSEVKYTFAYWAEDTDVTRGYRAQLALRSLFGPPLPGGGPERLLPRVHAYNFQLLDKADDRLESSVFVSEYVNQRDAILRNPRETFDQLLRAPKSEDAPPLTVRNIVLNNRDRDFFDLKMLHDQGVLRIEAKSGDVQTVYRMDLNIQAVDNNVDSPTGPKTMRNAEPIRLRIVSEAELLVEIGKEQETLSLRLDEALNKLAAAKVKYEFVRKTNGKTEQTPLQVDAVKVRGQDAAQDVEKARDIVQSVGREFVRIAGECRVNRLNTAAQKQHDGYVDDVNSILTEAAVETATFPKTQDLLTKVQNELNLGRWAPLAAVQEAESSVVQLEARLKYIRDKLGEATTKEKLKNDLLTIQAKQTRIYQEIRAWQEYVAVIQTQKFPTITVAGVTSISKGQTAIIAHNIQWNQYDSDTIKVALTATDADGKDAGDAITVTKELVLDFEKHPFKFDYAVKAGNKPGTYKVTLTPAAGPPVVVQVKVE